MSVQANALTSSSLYTVLDRFGERRIAVVGDLIADEFVYGHVKRVSREAPVLVLAHDSTTMTPGGAGNAACNVAALSGQAILVGVVGNDDVGQRLPTVFPARVDVGRVLRVDGYRTPLKTRILAGGAHAARQQVVRIDREPAGALDRPTREAFEQAAVEAALEAEAVLISDYGGGLVTPSFVAYLRNAVGRTHRGQTVPILLDSRYDLRSFTRATLVTPSESELEAALGVRIGDDLETLEQACRRFMQEIRTDATLVTRGSRGMALLERGRPITHIPVFGTDEIADVAGTGDTVIATAALALASGGSFLDAARLANYAAGLVVRKQGTATVAQAELEDAVATDDTWGGAMGLAATA